VSGADHGLDSAAGWFEAQADMVGRFGTAIRQSFDEVFDGQRTGRYRLSELAKVEKTYIGTKVEIVVQAEFGLERGRRMDYLVSGEEVDAKWTMTSGNWMIPREAVGELCLCITADDNASTFQVGIVRADDIRLRTARNQDSKRRLTPQGLAAMRWLINPGDLPENLLLHLDEGTRRQVLNTDLSGQARIDQLFRLVQRRPIRREVVLTVARQDDGPKRVRDARIRLRAEGIVILGHQGAHPAIALALGLPVVPKGSWVSARIVPDSGGAAYIDGAHWRLATEQDPVVPGPASYTR